jgi:hypothetical protein
MSAPSIVDLTADAAKMKAAEDTIEGKEPDLPEIHSFVDWKEKYDDAVAELAEAQQECAEQISACAEKDDTIAELKVTNTKYKKAYNKFVLDHGIFAKGLHELNHLRTVVQDLQNLNVSVKDAFAHPVDLDLIMAMEPAKRKVPFVDPLSDVPQGTWGKLRIVKVGQNAETGLPQPDGEGAEYLISASYVKYRAAFALHMTSNRLFKCAYCAHPLHHQYKWCMCMKCLAVPYCNIACVEAHKPGHWCSKHRVWAAPAQDEAKGPTTTSSSSSSTSTSATKKRKVPPPVYQDLDGRPIQTAKYTGPVGQGPELHQRGRQKGQSQWQPTGQLKGSKGGSKGKGQREGKGQRTNCIYYLQDGRCNNRGCTYAHDVQAYMAAQGQRSYQGMDATQAGYDSEGTVDDEQ